MHRNTKAAAILGGSLSLLVLSGCGLGSAPAQTADTGGDVTGTITFQTMQLSPTFDDYINGVIADFEEEYPGTKVEWSDIPSDQAARKVSADSVAGSLPDVMDLDAATLAPLGREGRVLDMAEEAGDLEDLYIESAWKTFDYGDTAVAALPWYLNSPVLMENSALTAQAGSEVPTTYSELFDVAEEIAAATGKAGFQPTSIGLPNYLLSAGVPLVNEDSTAAVVNTPEAVELIGRLAELYAVGGIPADSVTAAQRTEIDTFSQGETAYLETGPSRLKIIGENAPQVLESLKVSEPLGASEGTTWVVAHGLAVSQTSENAATALAFAAFLTSPENQLALAEQSSVFPSTAESLEADFFQAEPTDLATQARQIVANSLFEGGTMPKPAAVDSEYASTLWTAVQTAITGETPVEQALADAEAQLTEILEARAK